MNFSVTCALKDLEELVEQGRISIIYSNDVYPIGDKIDCRGVDCDTCILNKYRDQNSHSGCIEVHNKIMNYCIETYLHPDWFL